MVQEGAEMGRSEVREPHCWDPWLQAGSFGLPVPGSRPWAPCVLGQCWFRETFGPDVLSWADHILPCARPPPRTPAPPPTHGDVGSVSDRGKGKPWQGRGSLRLENLMGTMGAKEGSETELGYEKTLRKEESQVACGL